jgi:hypothetical protein
MQGFFYDFFDFFIGVPINQGIGVPINQGMAGGVVRKK